MKSETHRRFLPRGAGLGGPAAEDPSGVSLGPSFFSLGIGTGIAPKPKNRERWGAAAEMLSSGRAGSHFTRAFKGTLGELLRVPGGEDAGDSSRVLKWMTVGG